MRHQLNFLTVQTGVVFTFYGYTMTWDIKGCKDASSKLVEYTDVLLFDNYFAYYSWHLGAEHNVFLRSILVILLNNAVFKEVYQTQVLKIIFFGSSCKLYFVGSFSLRLCAYKFVGVPLLLWEHQEVDRKRKTRDRDKKGENYMNCHAAPSIKYRVEWLALTSTEHHVHRSSPISW